jgi:uncharacterized peroxidase-related enzyme
MGSREVPDALARDHRTADLAEQDRAMVDYAVTLTLHPHRIDAESVARLREVGFDERAILDICQVVAYYNYVNRLADGLGVELEGVWSEERYTIGREEFDARVAERHGAVE